MRPLVILATWLAAALVLTVPAGATTATAADFAADCADDGRVDITGVRRFAGGSAVVTADCSIVFEAGATLVFRRVDITGTGNIVAISSPERTTLKVLDSTIAAAGALELTTGCCAGDQLVPEYAGRVVVRNSTLSGSSVQLLASFDWERGRVVVDGSTLIGTGPLGVQVRASDLGGTRGIVKVSDSTIVSGGDILIRTGSKGRTDTRRTTFDASGAVEITTGRNGSCRATGHTPPTPCT